MTSLCLMIIIYVLDGGAWVMVRDTSAWVMLREHVNDTAINEAGY